jgi:hypothetical protein
MTHAYIVFVFFNSIAIGKNLDIFPSGPWCLFPSPIRLKFNLKTGQNKLKIIFCRNKFMNVLWYSSNCLTHFGWLACFCYSSSSIWSAIVVGRKMHDACCVSGALAPSQFGVLSCDFAFANKSAFSNRPCRAVGRKGFVYFQRVGRPKRLHQNI